MDSHGFASLAQIRFLLVPVGPIKQSTFDKHVSDLKAFHSIRLSDIPSDLKDERARFMPSPQSSGYLHITFVSHPNPSSLNGLTLWRTSQFPLAIIGIGSCSKNDTRATSLAQFNTSVSDYFPADSIFPFTKHCFFFEEADGAVSGELPGSVLIPSVLGNKHVYIGTLLADLCSAVLGELGRVMLTLESPIGNEYLNASMFPTLPPLNQVLRDSSLDISPPVPPKNDSVPEMGIAARMALGSNRSSTASPSPSSFRQSTIGTSSPSNAKKRQTMIGAASSPGRQFKVLGDFFLIAGGLEAAVIWYTEAIILFKSSQDYAWHASALEGQATVLFMEAWAAGNPLPSSSSSNSEPWAPITEKLNQALALYQRGGLSVGDGEYANAILAYAYCSCALRQATLYFSVWSANGWGGLAFSSLLKTIAQVDAHATFDPSKNKQVHFDKLTFVTGITRSTISNSVALVHGPWLLHLGPRERLGILQDLASLYGGLEYKRKQAFILREIYGCVMDLIVCGRDQDKRHVNSGSITGMGSATTGEGTPLTAATVQEASRMGLGIRHHESAQGNDSILKLVRHVCNLHGIDLDSVKLLSTDGNSNEQAPEKIVSVVDQDEQDLNQSAALQGWSELQVGIIREAIAVAESLADYPVVAQIALSSLKTLHSVLAPGDQKHLYDTSGRALRTAHRRGDARVVEYWAGQPILSISVSPTPLVRLPIETPISALQPKNVAATAILTGVKDPFLYNPRKSHLAKGRPIVVEQEPFEIVVILRNPFVFDLDLQKVALSTTGVNFESTPVSVIIPGNSFHALSVVGHTTEPGILNIRGCIVQAPGGVEREFLLPLASEEEETARQRRRSAIQCEVGRSKLTGLQSRPSETQAHRASLGAKHISKVPKFLECQSIPQQPLLRIRRTSITHGAVMMYNGEMSTFRLTVENVSDQPIDFLRLTFDDSTVAPAQQALAEGEMSVFDTYETEYELIQRPTFTWQNESDFQVLEPNRTFTAIVNCFGKSGCTNGAINVSYASVRRTQENADETPKVFYTRQITYPLLVTVYNMLECHGMTISAFEGHRADDQQSTLHDIFKVSQDKEWCLFSVEVRNSYGLPFEVTFDRENDDSVSSSVSVIVAPGATSRAVLPVPRLSLSGEQVSRPIPTLSDRQFVVSKSVLTSEQEQLQRELFWYREKLFNTIKGKWREVGGSRSGDLSLREQRLTLPMLEHLRTPAVKVELTLNDIQEDNSRQPVSLHAGAFLPSPNTFTYVNLQVTNASSAAKAMIADFTAEPSEHLIYEGSLTNVSLGVIKAGDSATVDIPVCFLSGGKFDISVVVTEVKNGVRDGRVGLGKLKAEVKYSKGSD